MNGTDLLEKMELVDPTYVEEADRPVVKNRHKQLKWTAMAACLCLVLVGAFLFLRHGTEEATPSVQPALEAVSIPELSTGGAGYEAYLCFDISELENGNPWSAVDTLPVYRNGSYHAAGIPTGLSMDEMTEMLNEAVSALKLTVLSTQPDGTMSLTAETNFGTVQVEADGTLTYLLPNGGLALPSEYHFTVSESTDEEAQAALDYLIERFSDFLGFRKPIGVCSYDRSSFGEQNRQYFVYDAEGTEGEQLLSYCFRSVSFAPNENGELFLIRVSNGLLCAEKMGDYPIISQEKAIERLKNGNYQTSCPDPFTAEEDIAKVELVYRNSRTDEVFLPYYRFYVRQTQILSETADAMGLEEYAIYYVPALTDESICNMPLYTGRFN